MDGRTNQRTNGRTDKASYRDARTHLKSMDERKNGRTSKTTELPTKDASYLLTVSHIRKVDGKTGID